MSGASPSPRRRRATPKPDVQLGSLSQAAQFAPGTRECTECGSVELTRVPMALTDGATVTFVSCQECEASAWVDAEGALLEHEAVLRRSGRR